MTNEIFAVLLPICDETLCSHYFSIVFGRELDELNF